MNVTELLARVPLFSSLTDSERAAIAETAVLRTWKRGERIVSQGEPGDAFFVIVRGRVSVSVSSPEGREVVLRDVVQFHWEFGTRGGAAIGELSVRQGCVLSEPNRSRAGTIR